MGLLAQNRQGKSLTGERFQHGAGQDHADGAVALDDAVDVDPLGGGAVRDAEENNHLVAGRVLGREGNVHGRAGQAGDVSDELRGHELVDGLQVSAQLAGDILRQGGLGIAGLDRFRESILQSSGFSGVRNLNQLDGRSNRGFERFLLWL